MAALAVGALGARRLGDLALSVFGVAGFLGKGLPLSMCELPSGGGQAKRPHVEVRTHVDVYELLDFTPSVAVSQLW